MRKDTLLLFTLLLMLLTAGIGFLLIYMCARMSAETETQVKVVYKEVFYERPAPVVSKILPDRYFFIPVEKATVVTVHDSTFVQVPVEQKEYQDTLYHAWVSGYKPQLDSIRLNIPTTYITTTVTKPAPRFSFGVTVGPTFVVTPAGALHGGIGATFGLQYRF